MPLAWVGAEGAIPSPLVPYQGLLARAAGTLSGLYTFENLPVLEVLGSGREYRRAGPVVRDVLLPLSVPSELSQTHRLKHVRRRAPEHKHGMAVTILGVADA